MKGSKRIIANIIACVLLFAMFTTSIAYGGVTAGTNESGGGGYISQSKPLAIRANGVILGLEMVKNTTTVTEQEKIEERQQEFINNSDKLFVDEVGFSTINQYLYEYPEFLCRTDLTERYALVIRDIAEKKDIDVTKQVLVDGTGRRSDMPFKKVYRCASRGTVSDYTFPTLFSGTLSDEDKKAFMAGELGIDKVKSYVSAHKSELDSAVASFAGLFTQMGLVSERINGILEGDEEAKVKLLKYLDFIIMIYYMTGENSQAEACVTSYLKNRNEDGSESFVTLFMASVVSYSPAGGWEWFTLPNYYGFISGKDVARYRVISTTKAAKRTALQQMSGTSAGKFESTTEAEWIKDYYNQFNAVTKGKFRDDGNLYRYAGANKALMWWSKDQYNSGTFDNWKSATMLMPTDLWGDKTGSLGFTYFNTSGVCLTDKPQPRGSIKLYIDEDKKVNTVEKPGTKTSATVVIDLDSSKEDMRATKETFLYAEAKNKPVKVTIQLSAKTVQGSPVNTSNFDSLLMPSGLSINSSNQIVWNDVTWDEFKPYMTREKVLKFNDADITINDTTKIEYYAKLHIEVLESPVTVKGDFKGKGEELNPDEYTAQTSWTCTTGEAPPDPTDPDPPKTGSFHSTMEQPYVEIKEGTPGNETFEAMAGVPTNRNLYVSFGASEFMLNLEVEMKTGDESQRTYKLTFTASKCYDTDELCKYYCDGHEYNGCPNGCGAYTCGLSHVHTDECPRCTTGKPTSYDHEHGAKTITSKCSCGRMTSAPYQVVPTYGDGCTNSCTAGGTKCYTGMGCKSTCHKTQGDANKAHAYTKTFTVTINQKIAEHPYLAITGLDLWQVTELALKGNSLLLTNPNVSVDPNTGYYAFYGEDGYSSNNGRLSFSQWLTSTEKLGNTEISKATDEYLKPEEAAKKATEWVDNLVKGKKVKAEVISDYLVLATTMGYQVPLFTTYSSDEVEIISESVAFTADETSKTLDGNEITFSTPDSFNEMWTNNASSAANWNPDAIVRSGYNGLYNRPADKFMNISKSVTPVNPLSGKEYLVTDKDDSYGAFSGNGLTNLRMSITGLGIKPTAENKEWDTGIAELTAKKVISFGTTHGINYANSGNDYVCEVGYTSGKPHINNIVIHNPVSTQYATVIVCVKC